MPAAAKSSCTTERRVTIRGVYGGATGCPPVVYDVREVGAPPFPLENARVEAEEIR